MSIGTDDKHLYFKQGKLVEDSDFSYINYNLAKYSNGDYVYLKDGKETTFIKSDDLTSGEFEKFSTKLDYFVFRFYGDGITVYDYTGKIIAGPNKYGTLFGCDTYRVAGSNIAIMMGQNDKYDYENYTIQFYHDNKLVKTLDNKYELYLVSPLGFFVRNKETKLLEEYDNQGNFVSSGKTEVDYFDDVVFVYKDKDGIKHLLNYYTGEELLKCKDVTVRVKEYDDGKKLAVIATDEKTYFYDTNKIINEFDVAYDSSKHSDIEGDFYYIESYTSNEKTFISLETGKMKSFNSSDVKIENGYFVVDGGLYNNDVKYYNNKFEEVHSYKYD